MVGFWARHGRHAVSPLPGTSLRCLDRWWGFGRDTAVTPSRPSTTRRRGISASGGVFTAVASTRPSTTRRRGVLALGGVFAVSALPAASSRRGVRPHTHFVNLWTSNYSICLYHVRGLVRGAGSRVWRRVRKRMCVHIHARTCVCRTEQVGFLRMPYWIAGLRSWQPLRVVAPATSIEGEVLVSSVAGGMAGCLHACILRTITLATR